VCCSLAGAAVFAGDDTPDIYAHERYRKLQSLARWLAMHFCSASLIGLNWKFAAFSACWTRRCRYDMLPVVCCVSSTPAPFSAFAAGICLFPLTELLLIWSTLAVVSAQVVQLTTFRRAMRQFGTHLSADTGHVNSGQRDFGLLESACACRVRCCF
jgi:hypothetical protein